MRTLKQIKRWFLCLLVVTGFPVTSFAINLNPTSVKGVAQAYGFILGQEYSLARIANEFPELLGDVDLARAQFDLTFPDIKTKLETQLKKAMGEKPFQEAAANLQEKIRETIEHQKISREIAANFLEQFQGRSKGEIESPIIEYLLAVKYTANPVGEFADGFRQRYQTDGMGKSQGINLHLQLPRSWVKTDGERPHIVQKWVSENGTGLEMILLDIRDGRGYNPTKKEMKDFVRSGEVKDTVPNDSKYIDSGNFTLEQQTGYWLQIATPLERAGMKMYQDTLIYQFFFHGKAIGVFCQAGGPENKKPKINEAFKRIRPLCQQVLNSLVLTQAY
ncbi:MAG: hypothetical protein JST38_03880 [Bacteroidetes bacterium]|nr:hypothetical protein [Pseudomonadota bacterium]MBS1939998.1 hypothetical protein [Bacteroidota bacterium]